jgi:ribosomal protein L37AE/L43A
MDKQTACTAKDIPPLCPVCGRELYSRERIAGGWNCKCGEFIPEGTEVSPFSGSSGRLTGEHHKRIKG